MKRMHMVVGFLVSLAGLATASGADDVKEPVEFHAIEDVVYGNKDGLGMTMDVLTPAKGAKGIGVILVASGGFKSAKSNVLGDEKKRRDGEHWIQGLLSGGYTLFVARHGSTPRYFVPEMIEDIRRSVRFVRASAARFHVDPDHLGITSGSSGGHLALMVALSGDDGMADSRDPVERSGSRVQAVVAWFPPTDLVNWGTPDGYRTVDKLRPGLLPSFFGEVTDLEAQLRSISPICHVGPDDPPLLLIHGDRDLTVPLQQSRVLKDKYEAAGLGVEWIVHKGGGHTTWPGIMDDYPAVWAWFDKHLAAP
ncbi:MAG: alpha/beta hydrolase [Pirellulales bacterium]